MKKIFTLAAVLISVAANAQLVSDPAVNTDITPSQPTVYTGELGASPDGSYVYLNWWAGS